MEGNDGKGEWRNGGNIESWDRKKRGKEGKEGKEERMEGVVEHIVKWAGMYDEI